MKYKVLMKFRDKETGVVYKTGSTIELTEERAKEVLKSGEFISPVETEKAKKSAAKKA